MPLARGQKSSVGGRRACPGPRGLQPPPCCPGWCRGRAWLVMAAAMLEGNDIFLGFQPFLFDC